MKEKYIVVKKVLREQLLGFFKNYLELSHKRDCLLFQKDPNDLNAFSDELCSNSWCRGHVDLACETLLVSLLPQMEKIFDVELFPTYSYSRIYWKGTSMRRHIDRESCEYSASVCIDVDPEPWPIWFDTEKILLNPGDLVAYRGIEVSHWRDLYYGNQQIQIFLHYVDKNGPYKNFRYDGRKGLGLPLEPTEKNKITEKTIDL